jgi:hypothetical protein
MYPLMLLISFFHLIFYCGKSFHRNQDRGLDQERPRTRAEKESRKKGVDYSFSSSIELFCRGNGNVCCYVDSFFSSREAR